MPRFPKHAHLLKLDISLSQYIKYLSSLNNRDKERQIIYGDSRDVVFFTYRLMTGEKHELLPNTERIIKEIVERHQGEKDPVKCREEVFRTLHIDEWETRAEEGLSPGFVLYCRASTWKFVRVYQRELRDGSKEKGLIGDDSTGIGGRAVMAEQLLRSLCNGLEDKSLDQAAFYASWEAYLTAQGLSLDPVRCNDLGVWAAQRRKLDDVESDLPLEDS